MSFQNENPDIERKQAHSDAKLAAAERQQRMLAQRRLADKTEAERVVAGTKGLTT